jgi:hypothetical protein
LGYKRGNTNANIELRGQQKKERNDMEGTAIKTVRLTLKEHEARWLMGVLQNPLREDPKDESEDEYELRVLFFNTIKSLLDGKG